MTQYAWKLMNDIIPRSNLEAWHFYEPAVSGHHIINDYSGNNRHISCDPGNAPVLTADVLNGQPGWYFNGSRLPLAASDSFTLKHLFVVAAYEDAHFGTEFRGLVSGVTTGNALVGNNVSSDKFLDLGFTVAYRLRDVPYASNNQKAPMSNNFAVIELQIPAGQTFTGIQIGQQLGFTARRWKGWFFENVMYSEILNEYARYRIYQYFAMRYRLWQLNADEGLNIFPFPANRARTAERGQEAYVSEPYSGSLKVLVRSNFKRGFSLPFLLRRQAEMEAAEIFHAEHFPIKSFVFRDYRYYPPQDRVCRIISPIKEEGGNLAVRFNYNFDCIEAE